MQIEVWSIKGEISRSLTGEDVDADGQHKDGEDDEEDDRVDENGLAIGGEATEFDRAGVAG